MQKVHKCALIGGVVLFVWSAIFWMVFACQSHYMRGFQDEGDVASAIIDNAPESGFYILPYMSKAENPKQMKKSEEKMAAGPFVFAAVKLEGKNPRMGMSMVASLILKIVVAYIVSWLVVNLKIAERGRIVKFVALVGLVAALLVAFPHAIWFGFPAGYVVCALLDNVIGWILAGFAIAKCAK